MTPKEIKEGMTQGEWVKKTRGPDLAKRHNIETEGNDFICLSPDKPANFFAIVKAVNNTYGQGLNPEAYSEVVEALEEITSALIRFDKTGTKPDIAKLVFKSVQAQSKAKIE